MPGCASIALLLGPRRSGIQGLYRTASQVNHDTPSSGLIAIAYRCPHWHARPAIAGTSAAPVCPPCQSDLLPSVFEDDDDESKYESLRAKVIIRFIIVDDLRVVLVWTNRRLSRLTVSSNLFGQSSGLMPLFLTKSRKRVELSIGIERDQHGPGPGESGGSMVRGVPWLIFSRATPRKLIGEES
ncbi:hypothetical protein PCANC_16537 [Puccinia coronata f. sp. avenae]|uniref:Uncharacterized protein n=1 Tax=Puccinia coronata f. sp. avenae TaxID=200324 RepID=A0A2N5ULG8_9BASI|nr:hypothetical protein PCANC_16537 [Puccinia coronata f. sp. avenae]